MISYLNETLGELQHKVLILGNVELLSPDGQKIVILYKIVGSCTRQKYGFSDYTGCLLLSHPLSQDHTVIFKEFVCFHIGITDCNNIQQCFSASLSSLRLKCYKTMNIQKPLTTASL
jgi:hypothetical protein